MWERVSFRALAIGASLLSSLSCAGGDLVAPDRDEIARTDQSLNFFGSFAYYDLSVVSMADTLWERGDEPWNETILTTQIRNNGTLDVANADVVCLLGDVRFTTSTSSLRVGQTSYHYVWTRTRIAALPPGDQNVTCTVSIRNPSGIIEANTTNNTRTETVHIPATPPPDLAARSVALYDCETRATPVAGRPACTHTMYWRTGDAIASSWILECQAGGVANRVDMPGGPSLGQHTNNLAGNVRFESLTAGTHEVSCTVDATNVVAEGDELNNRISGFVTVAGSLADLRYDFGILWSGKSPVKGYTSWGGAYPMLPVQVGNWGNQEVLSDWVRCTMGNMQFSGTTAGRVPAGGMATVYVHSQETRWDTLVPGTHSVSCTSHITTPQMPDADPTNDSWTGTITVL